MDFLSFIGGVCMSLYFIFNFINRPFANCTYEEQIQEDKDTAVKNEITYERILEMQKKIKAINSKLGMTTLETVSTNDYFSQLQRPEVVI